jgi:hypothetical protein
LYTLALLNAALRPFFEGFNWARCSIQKNISGYLPFES